MSSQLRVVGKTLLALLLAYLVTAAGVLACGVGLLVALPVAALFLVYTYRALRSGTAV